MNVWFRKVSDMILALMYSSRGPDACVLPIHHVSASAPESFNHFDIGIFLKRHSVEQRYQYGIFNGLKRFSVFGYLRHLL